MSENIITNESIDLSIEQLESMEDGKLEKLFNRMAEQQPNIMGFVLGLGEGLKNEEAEEDLLYLVMIVWYAIELQKKTELETISEESMEAIQVRIEERLDHIMSFSSEEEEDEFEALISASTQPAILSYLSDEFFSEEYEKVQEIKIGKMFACLSVISEAMGE